MRQERLTERALELLALPEDGVPKVRDCARHSALPPLRLRGPAPVSPGASGRVPQFLLDIGCGSGMSGETISGALLTLLATPSARCSPNLVRPIAHHRQMERTVRSVAAPCRCMP
jgi:hypothetical protein